jgi:hypothetical protein
MGKLFSSRKFLVLLVDSGFGLATLFVTFFIAENVETQAFVLAIFAVLQPVFYGVINGITQEDSAALSAGVHPNQVFGPPGGEK